MENAKEIEIVGENWKFSNEKSEKIDSLDGNGKWATLTVRTTHAVVVAPRPHD